MTKTQIEQLWYEAAADAVARAAAHGDFYMAAICAKALGKDYRQFALTSAERAKVNAMTVDAARAECERVVRNAH